MITKNYAAELFLKLPNIQMETNDIYFEYTYLTGFEHILHKNT